VNINRWLLRMFENSPDLIRLLLSGSEPAAAEILLAAHLKADRLRVSHYRAVY
jgi:hypothetical protein